MPYIPNTLIAGASSGLAVIYDSLLGADTASWDIQGIPATYKHLMFQCRFKADTAADTDIALIRFNNDSGATQYDTSYFESQNGAYASTGNLSRDSGYIAVILANSASASRSTPATVHITDYAGTTFYKSWTATSAAWGATQVHNTVLHGEWRDTSAINRITVLLGGAAKYKAGSRLTVYGL